MRLTFSMSLGSFVRPPSSDEHNETPPLDVRRDAEIETGLDGGLGGSPPIDT